MFFYIGNSNPIQSMNKVTDRLYLDSGWEQLDNIWYKGYSTDCKLSDHLHSIIDGYQPAGKWCVIHNEKIYHPVLRGFPLYSTEDGLSNIKFDNSTIIYYNEPKPPVIKDTISLDEASEIIGNVVLENTVNFFKYNNISEMNVLFSGGLDTLTGWAVMDYYTKNYILNIFVQQGSPYREYKNDLVDKLSLDYWGYRISNVYKDTNWYITGFHAETMQFRDAVAINALANYQGKLINELATENDYLYWFLKRPVVIEKFKNSSNKFFNQVELKEFLYKTIYYEGQMWHLDNNMTFSPLFDIRIPNTMMRLSIEDITKNCTTGIIQRKIVERFNPKLSVLLSDYKNENGVWNNFKKNWADIKLDPAVKLNVNWP